MELNIDGVKFAYGSREILGGISFRSVPGEIVGILGQNGCGKTTLLKCINKVLSPSEGSVLLDDMPVRGMTNKELARNVAIVSQESKVAFPFSVYDMVQMGRYAHGTSESEDDEAIHQALSDAGALDFVDRTIDQLSGGERRRVFIARALVQNPKVMLLDEPTLHLDISHQFDLMELMVRLARERGMLVVFVTHDIVLAARFCDRAILLKDGMIFAAGDAADVIEPRNLRDVFGIDADIARDDRIGMNVTILGRCADPRAEGG